MTPNGSTRSEPNGRRFRKDLPFLVSVAPTPRTSAVYPQIRSRNRLSLISAQLQPVPARSLPATFRLGVRRLVRTLTHPEPGPQRHLDRGFLLLALSSAALLLLLSSR